MANTAVLSAQELYKLISSHSSMPACFEVIRLSFLRADMYIFPHIVIPSMLKCSSLKRYSYHETNFPYLNIMPYWLSINFFEQHAILGYFYWKYTCHKYLLTFVNVLFANVVMKSWSLILSSVVIENQWLLEN